jgi:hypothetical protein
MLVMRSSWAAGPKVLRTTSRRAETLAAVSSRYVLRELYLLTEPGAEVDLLHEILAGWLRGLSLRQPLGRNHPLLYIRRPQNMRGCARYGVEVPIVLRQDREVPWSRRPF